MHRFLDRHHYGTPYVFVHPYKQQAVKQIIDSLPDWVEMAIVFGSAVQNYCTPESDIDLCIIGLPPNPNNYGIATYGESCDILQYDTKYLLTEQLHANRFSVERNIYEKGIVLYAREHQSAQTS